MIPHPRFLARSSSLVVLSCVVGLFGSAPAMALQLRWSTGTTDLTVNQNTQAVLVVQADSAETALPNSWRLLWTADSLGIQLLSSDQACLVDTAKVDSIAPPTTPADSAANQITAHFCSSGSGNATTAAWLIDLPAGGHGKLKVVALNPADTSKVIESNEVAFNGGIGGDYQPLVLSATQSRSANTISVRAVGAGLNLATQARIVSRDADWSIPLATTSQSSEVLVAAAQVPACLPPAVLELGGVSGYASSVPLPGDVVQAPTAAYSYGKFHDPIAGTRPKDFSFFYDNLGHFHLFFINTYVGMPLDPHNERYFGHTKGTDLRDDWSAPDTSFHRQGTGWESQHVWAPTIMQLGPTYYMFYTGVDQQSNQSIGVVSTDDINNDPINWGTRPSSPIVSRANVSWIDRVGSAQCRDPFIMRAPYDSTIYVMLYSTQYYDSSSSSSKTTIGIAHQRSNMLTQTWFDDGRLQVTDVPSAALTARAESPHAFVHINARGDTSYYVCASGNDEAFPGRERLLRNRRSPWDYTADTTAGHWNLISSLYDQLGWATLDQDVFNDFNASEYCKMYNHEYLAGVNATIGVDSTYAVWITMIQWLDGGSDPDVMALLGPVTGVGGKDQRGGQSAEQLRLLGRWPGQGSVVLEMSVPRAEHVELAIYDIAGRTVKRLASGTQLRGSWRVPWDGRDELGIAMGSGVYFARMSWPGGARVARVVVLR